MSGNRRHDSSETSFTQKLTWTVLFGLIFGAGLVTGQRLLANGSSPPLVSVQSDSSPANSNDSSRNEAGAENGDDAASSKTEEAIFSFYDQLAGSDSADESGSEGDEPGRNENAEAAKYTLQVSAFPKRDRARSRMRRLEKMGLDPYLVAAELPEKGTYYRVRIGKFTSMTEARTFKRELKRKRGVDTILTPL